MICGVVARWKSKSGKHWAELYRQGDCYGYRSADCGGNLGILPNESSAFEIMERRVRSGYFLPDSAKTPMHLAFRNVPEAKG